MTGRGRQFIVSKNLPYPCPAGCGKCFQTEQGQNYHVSSAKSCAWYKKGKLAEVTAPEEDLDELEPGDVLGDLHQIIPLSAIRQSCHLFHQERPKKPGPNLSTLII